MAGLMINEPECLLTVSTEHSPWRTALACPDTGPNLMAQPLGTAEVWAGGKGVQWLFLKIPWPPRQALLSPQGGLGCDMA